MSFGPSAQTKQAANSQQQISQQAVGNSQQQIGAGLSQMGLGNTNTASGTNYFNTLLNGNQANTSAMLQPQIQQIRQGNQQQLNSLSTLMPRGGGREGSLFAAQYAPESQISSLFNQGRTAAASELPTIGLAQAGLGAQLVGAGNSALNTGTTANQGLLNYGTQQQQLTSNLWSGLGSGIAGLATAPFGGGSAKNGLFGLIP